MYVEASMFDRLNLLATIKIKIEVSRCTPYLMFNLNPNLSSIIPVMARGKDTKGIKFPNNDEKNMEVSTKEVPPDVAVGNICELLLLGKSKKYF